MRGYLMAKVKQRRARGVISDKILAVVDRPMSSGDILGAVGLDKNLSKNAGYVYRMVKAGILVRYRGINGDIQYGPPNFGGIGGEKQEPMSLSPYSIEEVEVAVKALTSQLNRFFVQYRKLKDQLHKLSEGI